MTAVRRLSLLIVLSLAAMFIVACGGGATPTQVPAKATLAPTSAPNVTAPTVTSTSAPVTAPTSAPTLAPTRAPSATPNNGVPSAASVVPQAIAKTRAATIFKSQHYVNLSLAFGAQYDGSRLFYANSEFNGKDAHLSIGGEVLKPINPKAVDEIQVYRVAGKTYMRGPAAAVGAPDNKWYVLPGDFTINGIVDTFNMLDQLSKIQFDWSAFKYDGSNINGALNCTVYTAGKEVVTKMPALVWFSGSNAPATVVEDGTISFWACNNGYLSQIALKLKGFDPANPDAKGNGEFTQLLSAYDSNIAIAAPAGAVPASAPAAPYALTMPTPFVSAPRTPAAATYDGTWDGKSSTGSVIQFRVEKNQITNASLNYSVLNSASERPTGCPLGDGGAHAGTVDATPINGNSFTLKTNGGGKTEITFAGTFKSNTTAEGTMHLKGVLSFCDKPYETDVTWSVTKQASATPTAIVVPTKSSTTTGNPQVLLDAFFQAVNSKNVDATLALTDNQVFYQFGDTNGIGKDKFKAYLTDLGSRGVTFTLSNYAPIGSSNINFSAQGSDNSAYKRCSATFVSGRLLSVVCFIK